jgi:predicted dehydrogenase
VRAVLVGCGVMSEIWVDSLPAGTEIAGFVDLDLAAAERRAGDSGAATGTDLATMLRHVHPDVVFDCTIPAAHPEVTLTALRAGCHVLGEKPMAESLPDARRMIAAAADARRVYAVSQNYRYSAGIRRLRRLLPRLGPLTTLHSDFFLAARGHGFRGRMAHPLLLDMSIHTFDMARCLSGADPCSVYCHEWRPRGSWHDGAASAVCIFEMSDGVVYTYRGSWCAPGCRTGWNAEWRAIGERGTALWDGGDVLRAEVVDGPPNDPDSPISPVEPPSAASDVEDVAAVIANFVACIEQGVAPETVCSDNIKSLAMVHAAVESARTGARVQVAA